MSLSVLTSKFKVSYSGTGTLGASLVGKSTSSLSSSFVTPERASIESSFGVEWLGNPIDLLTFLKIRTSGVFLNPASQTALPLVYGNWMGGVGVPCVNIDTENNVWLVADHPVSHIETIYVDGVPYASGADVRESYVDATGKSVAVVILPVKASTVSVNCLAKMNRAEELVTNPVDIIIDILTNVMEFNESFIDAGVMGKSKTFFIDNDVELRYVFNKENETVKSAVEKVSKDSRSLYLNRKGKHSIKPRSVAW